MKKKEENIQAIIFDLGNVLVCYDPHKAARQFYKGCRIPIRKGWVRFFFSGVEKSYSCGEISSSEFYGHAKKLLKIPVDFETFRYYWNHIFWENGGMDELLARLKGKYRLYLLSNTNEMHFEYIKENYPILRHFDRMFPSHEMGCRKPDRAIYRKVLREIKTSPGACLFIDDQPAFLEGARKAGIHGIRFRSREHLIAELKKFGVQVIPG